MRAPITAGTAWSVAGQPTARPVAADHATGRTIYATDIVRPGMLHGRVLHPPTPDATLAAVDAAAAERLPGVRVVRADGVIGVVAPDVPTADAALAALAPRWQTHPGPDDAELSAWLRAHPPEVTGWDGPMDDVAGEPDAVLGAQPTFSASYTTAFVAHAPLEKRAAVAEWDGERVTVWVGTQRPFGAREDVATRLGVDEADVRVIVPATGGAFGGKHGGDVAAEAAILARAVGRPVNVRWSRPDEFIGGYVRPAAIIDIRAALDGGGRLAAWEHTTWNAGTPGIEMPYVVAHRRIRSVATASPLRQGSYRALGATANTFAREVAIDELAALAGSDPLDFRLAHLDERRLADALVAAAERFGWRKATGRPTVASGHGLGLACGTEKDGYVATCAEVGVGPDGALAVVRLVTAFDCGAIVNPDNLRNQIEGATVMALGPALFEGIVVEDGRIANASMSAYRVPRFSDVPSIEVVLLDRPDVEPAGAGESPLICVAPAIANAIWAATGNRRRTMPLAPDGRV